jgi:hypothetical protein
MVVYLNQKGAVINSQNSNNNYVGPPQPDNGLKNGCEEETLIDTGV